MFKKKFKVRVKHYSGIYYCIEYAHYRFIPIWITIRQWFGFGHPSSISGFSRKLFMFEEAEKFAAKFKTIEDVQFFNDREELRAEIWERDEKKFIAKNVPYQTKQIR